MIEQSRYIRILSLLEKSYPDPRTALNFATPFQLLVATVLSAQCTDKRVNMVTEKLFQQWKTPGEFAELTEEELSPWIKSCGLYKTKARNIIAASRIIRDRFGGAVPEDFDNLLSLPGVGRKTANVILSNVFGQNALAVDTHVFRVSHRLGWTAAKTFEQTEMELRKILPENTWSKVHHWLIMHGRAVCSARKPNCAQCILCNDCDMFLKNKKADK